MKSTLPLFLFVAFASLPVSFGETPNAPQVQAPQEQQGIESTSAQNLLKGPDGNLHLARWSLSMFAVRDKNGWGPSSRVDYRISNRWGLAATEVKSTVSAGFTVRLGALK